MTWLRTPEVKAELDIAEHLVPAAVLCLGYAAIVPEAVPRTAGSRRLRGCCVGLLLW
jgi:hypothetical protein